MHEYGFANNWLCMILPGSLTDIIGLTACASVLAAQYIGKKRELALNG